MSSVPNADDVGHGSVDPFPSGNILPASATGFPVPNADVVGHGSGEFVSLREYMFYVRHTGSVLRSLTESARSRARTRSSPFAGSPRTGIAGRAILFGFF